MVVADHTLAISGGSLEESDRPLQVAGDPVTAGEVVPGGERIRMVGAEDSLAVFESPLKRGSASSSRPADS